MPKRKILVVDDEPETVNLIKKNLEYHGFEVLTAYDGDEGLRKVEEDKPDLILLDLIMPRRDGLSMFKRLKNDESTRRIPVILLTAKGETQSVMEAVRAGATEYFIKPCDWKEMLDCINEYLK